MRILLTCAALAALAAPVLAQGAPPSDTLKEVTTKGIVINAGGIEIPVTYKPDGTFSATIPGLDMPVAGKWRADGDKLCTTSEFAPQEECVPYPLGKKSGDSFEVVGGQGPATVKIN
jgi:hypothetical protein